MMRPGRTLMLAWRPTGPAAGATSPYRLGTALLAVTLLASSCVLYPGEAIGPRDPLAEKSSDDRDASPETGSDRAATLRWSGCKEKLLEGLECSTLLVPLDPADPEGETIELALSRRSAGQPSQRIGSLLINPGGPGGSGVELVGQLASVLSGTVLDRFDLVGFDPRGVGRSSPVDCIDNPETLNSLDGDPDTSAEIDALSEAQNKIVTTCVKRHPTLLPHLSTADAAHDLDQIRRAVGDEKLTYLGFSYGTELGATYASLFPDRVRALVLDGAVGPGLSDEELSRTQAQGFEKAFTNFVESCRQDSRCEAAPDARALYEKVRKTVELAPIPVGTPRERRDLRVGDFQIGVIRAMYDQALWFYLARGLSEAAKGNGATLLALADLYHERKPDGSYPNAADAHLAINCADSTERGSLSQAQQTAARLTAAAPTFGAQLGWSSLACRGWPLAAQPRTTIATTTNAPMLVVGTINDPATPYVWAEQLTKALGPTAQLLTWEGEGHTAYLKADCITAAVDAFLVELTVPTKTTCPADTDRADADFAGLQPDLRDAFVKDSGLSPAQANCVAGRVAPAITAADLVTLYLGELSDTLTATITAAVTACNRGA